MPVIPTISTMTQHGFSQEQAIQIRRFMETYHKTHKQILPVPMSTLEKIKNVLDFSDIKIISKGNNSRSPEIIYVDGGNHYVNTIMWVNGRFRIGNLNTILSRGDYEKTMS